jgi:hypothetical protein
MYHEYEKNIASKNNHDFTLKYPCVQALVYM